jgi:N-acetyl-alpha-D-muramate 1-phosphate uridylyltransferase
MKAMILAAGRGKRMRPLTEIAPKPLLKVDNYSLIEHLLMRLAKSGFTDIIINIAYLAKKIQQALGNGARYGVDIRYSLELEEGGLETGGGIFKALPLLGPDPFLVVSSDIWTDFPFAMLKHEINGLAHLVLVDNPPYHPQGDFAFSGGRLVAHGPMLTFANIGVYRSALFAGCQPGFFPLKPVLNQAAAQGVMTAEYYQGEWRNIGTPEGLQALRDAVSNRK